MSGHHTWHDIREQRLRAMTPGRRAWYERLSRIGRERLDHDVWVCEVEDKFRDALAAVAAGEPSTWHVWPPPDEQELIDAAAAEFGFAPWTVRHEPYDPAQDGEPADWAPIFLEEFQGDAYTLSSIGGTAIEDLYGEIERFRTERGPFLREIRCDSTVITYLALKIPERREAVGPQPWGIPIIQDDDVPGRHIRRVYDDGTTEDVEVMTEIMEALIRSLHDTVEFKPASTAGRLADYYHYGAVAAPFSPHHIITGI